MRCAKRKDEREEKPAWTTFHSLSERVIIYNGQPLSAAHWPLKVGVLIRKTLTFDTSLWGQEKARTVIELFQLIEISSNSTTELNKLSVNTSNASSISHTFPDTHDDGQGVKISSQFIWKVKRNIDNNNNTTPNTTQIKLLNFKK